MTRRSLRALSPSPRPGLLAPASCNRSRSQLLLRPSTTTPRISRDLRRCCLVFKRDQQISEHLTAPLPYYLHESLTKKSISFHKTTKRDYQAVRNLGKEAGRDSNQKHKVKSIVNDSANENNPPPGSLEFDSPGFYKALQEFEISSPAAHSPNCIHPSPSQKPLYSPPPPPSEAFGWKQFIGRGSFGNVSLCKYQSHCFALKIINRATTNAQVGERNLLGIRHTHIATVFRVTEVFDKIFVCMEFAGHHNLQYLLDHKTDLDFKSKLSFASQIASGLNHCHKNKIIHCDIKPANVIISPSGECKLGDFGLSIKSDDIEGMYKMKLTGTAAYTAPEALQGKCISMAADIYSFGIMLWQIYMNEVPFAGEHPHVIIYKVVSRNMRPTFSADASTNSNEYVQLASKCWSKEPDARPISTELLYQLKILLGKLFLRNCKNQRKPNHISNESVAKKHCFRNEIFMCSL